ncbi:MFS transporter [bacterium]|nr:MFS transporter [bacterium]
MNGNHSRLAVTSWCLYDFANSAFTTLVVTFIYATYFTEEFAGSNVEGTALWSRGVAIASICIAICSPILGALADQGGRKKYLLLTTSICIAATAGLYWIVPGYALLALAVFVIADIAFELSCMLYNAYLPAIAPRQKIGRISGYGWSLGYLGGLLAMFIALIGFIFPETPWFGFDKDNGQHIRATNLLVSAWFAVFSVPMFLVVKDTKKVVEDKTAAIKQTFAQLGRTMKEIRSYRPIVRFLIARLIYNDGLITIFAFGSIFAKGTFHFSMNEVMVFGIVLNVAAGIGAFGLGFLDDWLGAKRTLYISLAGLAFASILAVLTPSTFKPGLYIAGVIVGIFAGPNQSASRSLMGRLVPPQKENEFFGFYAFSGKLTAFMGPFLLGIITQWFDSQRAGISIVILFFLIGGLLLTTVDEKEMVR